MSEKNLRAEIITIGDEILIGQIIDTNSAWIAQQLNLIGIDVGQISSISDDKQHIINALNETSARSDLIMVTGGLGPTRDDRTKEAIAGYFESKLVRNQEIFDHVTRLLAKRQVPMNELNARQADVPDNCTVIPNPYGTAPGMWFEKNEKVYIFLPGVPYEMQGILSEYLLPKLKSRFKTSSIYHKTLMLQGIAESTLAMLIDSWEQQLPPLVKLAYLPSPGVVRLRLTAKNDRLEILQKLVNIEIEKLMPLIAPYYFGDDDEQLEMIISKILINNSLTISTAESCTGGKIAHLITSVPGSSAYYKGSVVAYSNEAKINVLNVDPQVINMYGAVSEEVVRVMAQNVRMVFHTDYAVAISGIAGPDGGSDAKPVGTTWIAVASSRQVIAKMFLFGDNRERNIQRASISALNELRKLLLAEIKKNQSSPKKF